MSNEIIIAVFCVVGLAAYRLGTLWWRRRRTAKQADRLLANVVKSKDAFRRQ